MKKVQVAPGDYIGQPSTEVRHLSAEEHVVIDTLSLINEIQELAEAQRK